MARLWAQQIIEGNKTFEQVPRLLKSDVRSILAEMGRADLAEASEKN